MPVSGAWTTSGLDAAVLAAALGLGVLYAAGVRRLRASESGRRALPRWRAAALLGASGLLVAGLAPPLQPVAEVLFAAHMGQHELLMLLVPPLLVLGRPMLAGLWALPARLRRPLGRALRRPGSAAAWRFVTTPLATFVVHGGVLWAWHAVPAFELALSHDAVHLAQHASFLASATLFWWALLHGRFGRIAYGAGVFYVFLTAIHTGALGALLFVSPRAWYPTHAARAAAAGVEPLLDQQLGGLLMWIPAGAVLIVIGLALCAAWLAESERRVRRGVAGRVPLVLLACVLALGCEARAPTAPAPGDTERGRTLLVSYGCHVCHRIPGVPSRYSRVGPPLDDLARRWTLAGRLPNSPDNLRRWIQNPQDVEPGNVMPDMGVPDADARDMVAYLLRQ